MLGKAIADALQAALRHHTAGRLGEAEELYRRILADVPRHVEALHLLGVVAFQRGQLDVAIETIGKAVDINGSMPEFHNNLGEAYRAKGDLDRAAACYRRALALKPEYAEAHYNLGIALREQGKPEEAVAHFRQAVALNPNFAQAYNDLGNALQGQGRIDEALECYQRAVSFKPDFTEAFNNLGGALHGKGQLEEAAANFRQAATLSPGFPEPHYNLGLALHGLGRLDEAITHYRQALALKPAYADACRSLGLALKDLGRTEEALACYEQGLKTCPTDGLKVLSATLLPVIPESGEHLLAARTRYKKQVAGLLTQDLLIRGPIREAGSVNFYLAYQGLDDRALQESVSRLYERACPSLHFTAGHCQAAPSRKAGRKLKVGFISTFFRNHTIGHLTRGLIATLPRRQFSVSAFMFSHQRDPVSEFISQHADRTIVLPYGLDAARRRIAEEQLDVLFYADIGMDPLTYFLAFARLAPVQCVTWGHPVTTGLATVDYFISSALLEPDNASRHYSEKLVRLSRLPSFYYRPAPPASPKSRKDLGVSETAHLYLCPQNLFKLHPDFDEVIAGILRADPKGELILIEGVRKHWSELLLNRFRKAMPDEVGRVRLLPRLSTQDFHSLLSAADVILDPLHWSGGNTTYEALSFGTPIVTLPSKFMRGRVTYGCYRQMGVLDCVASTKADYVKRAVRLGTDPAYRAKIKEKILAANDALYENDAVVKDLKEFFLKAVDGATNAKGKR